MNSGWSLQSRDEAALARTARRAKFLAVSSRSSGRTNCQSARSAKKSKSMFQKSMGKYGTSAENAWRKSAAGDVERNYVEDIKM